MRTRNQAKRSQEPSRGKDVIKDGHDSDRRICVPPLNSEESALRLSRCTNPHKSIEKKRKSHICNSESVSMPEDSSKGNGRQEAAKEVSRDAVISIKVPHEVKILNESASHALPEKEDTDESDWEDGDIAVSDSRDHHLDNPAQELIIQFDDSPSTSRKKPVRRASPEEKELAELVHKVHLLCLVARGRLVDSACNDPLIQASLLSLLPRHLQKIVEVPKLTANALTPIVDWFHSNFHVTSSSTSRRSFKENLSSTLENHEGTAEEVAALSVALFRALNLTTRFVSVLDVASLKPEADTSGSPGKNENRVESGIFNSSTLMVTRPSLDSTSVSSCVNKTVPNGDMVNENSGVAGRINNRSNLKNETVPSKCIPISPSNENILDSSALTANDDTSAECLAEKAEGSKRKGDLEFELQLEMALFATAAGVADRNLSTDLNDLSCSSYDFPSSKRIKRIKSEESPSCSQGISTAVGSRKTGPPLYWAEIFCSGENLTGKWVHVDVVNSIIDGEEKVEAAIVACRKLLRYVVAFAGNGAKDVTRRYCMKWYKIASKRVSSHWWDAVLGPLKELESGATGGMVHLDARPENALNKLEEKVSRISGSLDTFKNGIGKGSSSQECMPQLGSPTEKLEVKLPKKCDVNIDFQSPRQGFGVTTRNSLEDMELQTRALTEPLPTNQQAYKNHPLYAIERWLNKNQILHPKGPVLGYCSGHPVYPRSCVQMLQTKQRWLRDGLQVKSTESPAKVVKRSTKPVKAQVFEPGVCEEDRDGGTIPLYGKWQTESLDLPSAVNGIVPKNERGQVDVWSEKCLPHGTIHLRLPRLVPVAKRLEIDYAPAMVGFEFRNGRSVPVFDGIVVCTEFKDAIMEAYAEEEERRELEEKKQNEARAISRWYQLLASIITRQRLNETYGEGSISDIQQQSRYFVHETQNSSCKDDISNECHKGVVYKSHFHSPEDHEHIFPIEDQSFDEENSVRTKRCPCGFLVEVEEL